MNTSHSLDVCDYSGSITGEQGKPAGVTCTYCVEDSDDKDYNDFCVTAAKRRRQR
ncbi:MAG: hypothetical protein LBT06_10225 [Hungatella sp.]|nr:hypothetical protein [Hungatella sp.]